jgi:hypothetical protein
VNVPPGFATLAISGTNCSAIALELVLSFPNQTITSQTTFRGAPLPAIRRLLPRFYTGDNHAEQSAYRLLTTDVLIINMQARILMVGAGGIGCELLKNLVLTGFHEIHIVDLDTIDLSNLNRQFLFRHEHIKKSKALVSCLRIPKKVRNMTDVRIR